MSQFQGQVAVITGAGSGLGREFARQAARAGMKLVLADVEDEALAATRAELDAGGTEAIDVHTDVADAAAVEALAERAYARFGAVHLLFNNAGVSAGGLIWENSLADWRWTLGVNLWGVIHGVRSFTPRMLEAARGAPGYRGHIVNTASMAGLLNMPAAAIYNVSKHAVVALTETLYHDLALVTEQVGCSVLCPYFIPTGIVHSERNRPAALANTAPKTAAQRMADAIAEKAVQSAKMSAAEFAAATFAGVAERRFYIFSHPHALGGVRERMEDILAGRPPADAYAQRPDLKARLREAVAGA
jgi:NAD(P)-dependent dehydrogenase (short-subunit alcohol dehydrogenase family)